jgi:hypothetical protein
MLNAPEDVLIVFLIVAFSILFMLALNRLWPAAQRSMHNDVIGWQLSILGTTYAVILGFMLYTVWTNFGAATLNANSEANSLLNVYRLAEGLPPQQRTELEDAARAYVHVVLDEDWPAMSRSINVSLKSRLASADMWRILMSVKAATPAEISAQDHAISELSEMTEHRQMRQIQCTSKLPGVLWFVLIIGGTVTIMSSCLFGSGNARLHGLQVFAFSLLVALALVAIEDIDRPFQGAVHVNNAAFVQAQISMNE